MSTAPTPARTPITPKTPAPAAAPKQSFIQKLGVPRLIILILSIVLMIASSVLFFVHKVDKKIALVAACVSFAVALVTVLLPAKKPKVE